MNDPFEIFGNSDDFQVDFDENIRDDILKLPPAIDAHDNFKALKKETNQKIQIVEKVVYIEKDDELNVFEKIRKFRNLLGSE